ncbi:MAG TPA: PAS domain S-box protein, partial [Methylovirgula sp.]
MSEKATSAFDRDAGADRHLRAAMIGGGSGTFEWDFASKLIRWVDPAEWAAAEPRFDIVDVANFMRALDAAGRAEVREGFRQAVSDGHFEARFRLGLRDRDPQWLRARGHLTLQPDGKPDKIVGIVLDVAEQKEIEEELRAREEHLRLILETVPDAVIVIDEKGIVRSFSPAAERLFGWKAGEMVGVNIHRLMPEPDHSRHDGYMERYQRTGERKIIGIGRVVTGLRKDGSTFPMHLSVGEMRANGRRSFTGFVRDLTERQENVVKLEELQS